MANSNETWRAVATLLPLALVVFACGGRAESVDESDSLVSDASGEGQDPGDGDDGGGLGMPPWGDGDGPSSGGAPVGGDGDGDELGTGGQRPIVEVNDCVPDAEVAGVQARYERLLAGAATPGGTDFFAFPWPELTRTFGELAGFPNPGDALGCPPDVSGDIAPLLLEAIEPQSYRQYLVDLSVRHLDEEARHPAVYVSFDGPIGEERLPTPPESISDGALVFLMDVDPRSPELGQRIPLLTRVYRASRYLPENTLAAAPYPGFPLRSETRYALVVLSDLGDASGRRLGSSFEFEARKISDCDEPYVDYLNVFAYLEERHGLSRIDVAAMTLFDTGRPSRVVEDLTAAVSAHAGFPGGISLGPLPATPHADGYFLIEGTIELPLQQQGDAPHLPPLSGIVNGEVLEFEVSDVGAILPGDLARVAGPAAATGPRSETVQFALSIPAPEFLPDAGDTPLVVYGPGTGGSRMSPMQNGVAARLAELGVAVFAATPPMHGARAHAENLDAELVSTLQTLDGLLGTNYLASLVSTIESGDLFFNPLNLQAARGNVQQAALDYLFQLKTLANSDLRIELPGFGEPVGFEPTDLYFFGHSQGAGIGPLLFGSPDLGGAVLSGASGHIPSTILYKTEPADALGIPQMINYIVCDAPEEPLDVTHPMMSLIGHWFEPSDAELFARAFVEESQLPLFVVVGRDDSYAPPQSNHAITSAARLQELLAPVGTSPASVPGQALLADLLGDPGFSTQHASLSGNRAGVTAAFRQYHGPSCEDDHFVFVCEDQAMSDWAAFFSSALGGAPTVP